MARPLVLFGAFDRHNFGDLLFPHVAATLLPGRELIFAGLAARDLRGWGGHPVRALHEVLAHAPAGSHDLLHVGGEILTCSAWQAAVMLQSPGEVQATLAYLQGRPQERSAWVRQVTGSSALAPYVASRMCWPALGAVHFLGIGGVALGDSEPRLRAEVCAALRAGACVSVRDVRTQAQLRAEGVIASLLPDAAVLAAELFAPRWQQHARQGEVAQLLGQCPQGYLAVHCSADFGDDASVAQLTRQLDELATATGLAVVVFRAGAAPWHDDLTLLQRLAARMAGGRAWVFESLQLWDICALIAASRGYVGSSLHGRIVATACALPSLSLRSPVAGAQQGKTAAWVDTWEDGGADSVVDPSQLAAGMLRALARPPAARQRLAKELVRRCRDGFAQLRVALDAG